VNGVVEKPIRPEKLLAAMSSVLQIDTALEGADLAVAS